MESRARPSKFHGWRAGKDAKAQRMKRDLDKMLAEDSRGFTLRDDSRVSLSEHLGVLAVDFRILS
jgi:hypothetical protein